MSNNEEPYLRQIGANTREAASTINLDVSGTVGPDYLGQETVDVNGHWANRPGVQYRAPENASSYTDPETGKVYPDPDVERMDTGEELPVLLHSSMSTDPIEGTQGSYTIIEEGECARCGYDRIKTTVITMAGEEQSTCNACGAVQESREENGYMMPELPEERADRSRESGEILVSDNLRDLVLQNDRSVELVGQRSVEYVPIDHLEQYFWALVDNENIDLIESIESNYYGSIKGLDTIALIFDLKPEWLDIEMHANEDWLDEQSE